MVEELDFWERYTICCRHRGVDPGGFFSFFFDNGYILKTPDFFMMLAEKVNDQGQDYLHVGWIDKLDHVPIASLFDAIPPEPELIGFSRPFRGKFDLKFYERHDLRRLFERADMAHKWRNHHGT